MMWGCASTTADADPAPSTASAKSAPRFVHLQTWVSAGWRSAKAKQCQEHCKATKNMGAGHKLPSKAGFCSSDRDFHLKTKQAVPPGCFLQTLHFALLLGSHPTNQNCLEGETRHEASRESQGAQHGGLSHHPLARRVPPGQGPRRTQAERGADSPTERHTPGACCSRLGCCWGNGFVQGNSPRPQPTSTTETMQPAEPLTEQPRNPQAHNPGVKEWEENQPHR